MITASPARTQTLVRRHPLIIFFVLSYAVAWSLWLPVVISGDRVPAPVGFVLGLLGSLVPSTVGLLLVARLRGRSGMVTLLRRLLRGRLGLRWYLAVLALTMLAPLAVGVSVLMGGAIPIVDNTILGVLFLFAFMIFPGSALGEELGWRGFALPRLQARHSALGASLILGILWGLWHLPLWLTGSEGHPVSLFGPFVVAAIATSVICTWLYNGTGGSLLIIVLYHAGINLPITLLISPLGSQMTQPFLIYVALTLIAAAVVVIVTGARQLSRTAAKQVDQP